MKEEDFKYFDSTAALWSIFKLGLNICYLYSIFLGCAGISEDFFGQGNFITEYLSIPIPLLLVFYSSYMLRSWFSKKSLTIGLIIISMISSTIGSLYGLHIGLGAAGLGMIPILIIFFQGINEGTSNLTKTDKMFTIITTIVCFIFSFRGFFWMLEL